VWFDAVAARYAVKINGLTSIVISKLDVLKGLDEIKICVAYELDGKRSPDFCISRYEHAKPVYETMSGWDEDISSIKHYDDLPIQVQNYLKRIQELCEVPISMVSVGPGREQTIVIQDIL